MFITFPSLALVVGLVFFVVWRWRGAGSAMIAGLLWIIYGGYEYLMHARVLCSGECNIRVDLLAIYPFLILVSLVAAWNTARGGVARATRTDNKNRAA